MRRAALGWSILGAYIIAYDCALIRTGHPSLSQCFKRAPRPVAFAATAYIAGHLFSVWPERYDPLHHLGRVLQPNTEEVSDGILGRARGEHLPQATHIA